MSTQYASAVELLASALNCEPETLSSDSAIAQHPAWDSISHLNVMMVLEQEFGIPIDDVTIERFTRLSEVEKLFQTAT